MVNYSGLFHSLFWKKLKWSLGVKQLSESIHFREKLHFTVPLVVLEETKVVCRGETVK